MRILLTAPGFPPTPGGIATHAFELARGLADRSCQVKVVSPQDFASPESIRTFNRSASFEIVRLYHAPLSFVDFAYHGCVLRRELERFKADILITSGDRSAWLALFLRKNTRPRHVAIGHGSEFGRRPGLKRWLTRRSFQGASAVVCVSRYTQSRMHEIGICPERDVVIPNGADESRFFPLEGQQVRRIREQTGGAHSELLLTVGRLCERKGQDVVIRALAIILKHRPHVHYLMAGLPENEEDLGRVARESGVSENVHFLGAVEERSLVDVYNACDVFVLTSRHAADGSLEGYGIAVVEAALCGKPSVVARGSGLQEAIEADRTGVLVTENSPEETAAAILDLLQDSEKRGRMGEAARTRALAEQTWNRRMDAYLQLMEEVHAGKSK